MPTTFIGIATHDKLGQQFKVTGELNITVAGDWIGGITPDHGMPPLPSGEYTLRTNTGDIAKVRVTAMIGKSCGNGKRMQPFIGIGHPPATT